MMKLKFLNFWYRSAKRFSLLLIVSSIMISGLYAQNMSRYITLNVTKDSLIGIDLSADAVNTSIKIVSGTWDTTIIVGKSGTGYINYSSHDTVMTIYGNVNKFECSDNKTKITGIDVSKNVALCTLYCGSNQLTSLDVSQNTALTELSCDRNQLTSLDVSGCASLKTLYCYDNQLTSLNVSGCTALTRLTCYGNNFSTKAYNDIMCFLPSRSSSDNAEFFPLLHAAETNATKFLAANASIATAKNWKVVYVLSTNTSITTTGTAICDPNGGGSIEPVNINRYITLNVAKDSLIEIRFATDAANTPIRIVSGDSVYDILVTSTSLTNVTSYYAGADTMTIYGDVNAFYCYDNKTKITGIDASKNTALCTLYCHTNQLTSLDVSKNTALTLLNCGYNQLTSLDVSGCTALTYFYCYSNQLTSLDVSTCTSLKTLYCDRNQLTSLDVNGCTALTTLYCYDNQLTSLDVSQNLALTNLYCYRNQLTSLDVSKNLALTNLSCYGNPFTTKAYNDIMCFLPSRSSSDNAKFIPLYDATDTNATKFVSANASIATAKNWNVVYLGPNNTSITTTGAAICDPNGGGSMEPVNMSRYITLTVTKDSLIGIDLSADSANTPIKIVSGNWDTTIIAGTNWIGYINYPSYDTIMTIYGDVKSFYCYNNKTKVTEIDVSNNIALCTLYCANNQLTSLDVSQNTALISLNCHSNQLISLNVRGCTALIELRCYDNDLTSLDLSQNTALISLNCHSNQLTSLDVSNNIALTYLECYGNNFSTQAYNDIMCSLPSRSSSDNANFRPLYDATDTNATKFVSANASIATAKNWNVRYSVGGGIITTTGTDSCNQGSGHDTIPTVNMSRYITLTVAKDSLISIRFATDAANTPIRIVSGDSVYDILVTSTSVTNVTSYLAGADTMTIYGDVKEFNCYNNKTKITKIDVSNNIALCTLYCYENNIRALDVSKNTALCTLFCHTNQLTSLDVSACTALTNLSCRNNQLTSLDVSNNTSLRTLYCYGNPFTTAEYDAIMCSLPMKETSDNARYYPLYDANDINATKFVASNSKNAIDKNWNVQYGYNDSAIPSTTGDYDCDGGGGEDPEDTTNVTEIKLSNIELYPNPAKTMLTIENATENVQIFDITGREIMHVENKGEALLQINVSNLSKGMYFVKVGNYTTKFVKE